MCRKIDFKVIRKSFLFSKSNIFNDTSSPILFKSEISIFKILSLSFFYKIQIK